MRPTPDSAKVDPITEELRQLGLPPLTDAGNGERFAAEHAPDLRYVHGWDRWIIWDGKRWAIDHQRKVYQLAVCTLRAAKVHLPGLSNDAIKALVNHITRSEKRERIEAMLSLARSHPEIALSPDQFDRDPFALNVANGIVDGRTGRLGPHRRDAMLTKLAAVEYDEKAEAPTWLAFLEKVLPDAALRGYVQRAIGYSLTGDVGEHCLFFCYGTGRNGKTTMLEVLRSVAGDYAKTASPDLLLAKKADRHQEELADLHGARFVTTVEAGEGRYWDEAKTKWLTGGDRITARHMYSSRFSFAPTHKLWIAANHKPHARGTDLGFWRRVHLVPFAVTIAESEVDHDLRTKLEAELPGILRWAVDGAIAWREGGLRPPQAVRAATDEYRSREDVLGTFIADCCVLEPAAKTSTQELHEAYTKWAETNGERSMSKSDLGSAIEERPGIARYRSKSTRGFEGIGLIAPQVTGDAHPPLFSNSSYVRAREEKLSETASPASPASPAHTPEVSA